ncbi:MAG: hypothetical protein IJ438_04800 [Clostridia bacterium]|nr:hypothetical protein [Clostridia bacterium]
MQQPTQQPGRYFNQQSVHRFPQNNAPLQGYEQQRWTQPLPPVKPCADCPYQKEQNKHRKRCRFSIVWTIFALIGMATCFIQLARYVVIPLLVQLNILSGGTL